MHAIISIKIVHLIAIIDGIACPVPDRVQGIESAGDWLTSHHDGAEEAQFFTARRVSDHPLLTCGGVFEPHEWLATLHAPRMPRPRTGDLRDIRPFI